MIVGIDSSGNKSLVCVVFGSNENIHDTYKGLCGTFRREGWFPPLHWGKMASRSRRALVKPVSEVINKSDLKAWVFETKKPRGTGNKDYYLRTVPNFLAYRLEPMIRKEEGVLQIQADKDFEIKNTEGTTDFLRHLLIQLGTRLHGSSVAVLKSGKDQLMTLKSNEKRLDIVASSVRSENSKAVQIADVVLGIYCADRTNLKISREKI